MIHDWLSLDTYFSQFNGQFGIADYVFGTTDDILNRKAKVIRYPCLWLEFLGENIDDNACSHYQIRLTIQQNGGNQPRAKDFKTLQSLRKMLSKIIEQMLDDSPQELVFYTPKARFDFKDRFSGDDELLVQCELQIGSIAICDDNS